jgi:hypothetical protein
MTEHKRGRGRKHRWIDFQSIENDTSSQAQYLKWASVNNPALAQRVRFGCPRCNNKNYRLRHDKKFDNIRFYCPQCRFETSYHIIHPKKSQRTIEIYDTRGILIGVKNIDDYHDKTSREKSDSQVTYAEQNMDLGGEWFDGISGTNSQSRSLTREEIMKRKEEHRMKRLMKASLDDIEKEEKEHRSSSFESAIKTGMTKGDVRDIEEDADN